jgi:hypothetical protein
VGGGTSDEEVIDVEGEEDSAVGCLFDVDAGVRDGARELVGDEVLMDCEVPVEAGGCEAIKAFVELDDTLGVCWVRGW